MNLSVVAIQGAPSPTAMTLLATDLPRCWWRIENGGPWAAFVATHQPEPPPVTCDGGAGVIFVGAEQAVFALRQESGALVASVLDASDVRTIFRADDTLILVLAADQVLAFRPGGSLLWRQVLPDMVDDVRVQQDAVLVTDVAGETYALSSTTGRPMPP